MYPGYPEVSGGYIRGIRRIYPGYPADISGVSGGIRRTCPGYPEVSGSDKKKSPSNFTSFGVLNS